MDEKEYKNCYVAFLDILGFKYMIDHEKCNYIFSIYSLIKKAVEKANFNLNNSDIKAFNEIKYKVMSDSIIIYIEENTPDAFFALIRTCQMLQMLLLSLDTPILIRGGISNGNLFVENDIFFGNGLTQAYLIESTISNYPRIIFTNKLLSEARNNYKEIPIGIDGVSFYKDIDEYNVINFMAIENFFSNSDKDWIAKYIDNILNCCQTYIDSSYDIKVRSKYVWLKNETLILLKNKTSLLKLTDKGQEVIEKWKISN